MDRASKIAVWKFSLEIGKPTACLPRNAHPIKVSPDLEDPMKLCCWALADSAQPIEERPFEIYTTGYPIKNIHQLDYVDTVVSPLNQIAYHVFERRLDDVSNSDKQEAT
jgi:hypothetical protein